jgi:DNA-binding CsgD family transcriptional regulator
MFKYIIFLLFFFLSSNVKAVSDSSGCIWGTLLLDDSWEQNIYVSFIETIEQKHSVSNNMIISSSSVDSLGKFAIKLNNLTDDWCLLRLHVVKKGVSPASLIIGSMDENYYFIIANRDSRIELHNAICKPIFKETILSGTTYMSTFEYITKLSNYSNSITYEESLIEKEFIEDVVAEKMKQIADTCKNPLVSLYALYQTDFYSDYQINPAFYKTYLLKWKNENNTYFKSFRRQFPVSRNFIWRYILLLLVIGVFVSVSVIIIGRKGRKIKKLSVQERKIFSLLQKGASNQEISNECFIELSTVKSHVSSIFSKLNIKSRKDVVNLKL